MIRALLDFEGSKKLVDCEPKIIKAVQEQLISVGLLKSVSDGIAGKLTLAAFAKFKELEYLEYPDLLGKATAIALLEANQPHTLPKDNATPLAAEHKALFPKVGWVKASDRILLGGHFSWGEFTKDLTRVPQNVQVVENIIRLANYLEDVRSRFGKASIVINSGYRPPTVNRSVGGASNSQHLYGAAADIVVGGFRPHEVYKHLNQWHGDKGGLGDGAAFTHIDLRGYGARFSYG